MAVAVTMQLENDLKVVEDDLGSFIQSQKNSLLKEKLQLEKNVPHRQRQHELQNEDLPFSSEKGANLKMSEGNDGLNLGGYENKQKKLRDERQKEYKQYLEGQVNRRGRVIVDTALNTRNQVAQRFESNRKEYKSNIDKEYGNMLKSKKNEETLYRLQCGVEDGSSSAEKTGKKIIEFEDSDDELFNFVLKEKAKNKQRSSSGRTRIFKTKNHSPEDGRSSSVPPKNVPYILGGGSNLRNNVKNHERKKALEEQIQEKHIFPENTSNNDTGLSAPPSKAPYIFGGSSHSMLRKERNLEYKKALEEQIKEKQAVKMREKLKRMGRITSSTDLEEKVLINGENKKDQFSQYSEHNITRTNVPENIPQSNGNVDNVISYPNQNNYPMFNPMMNYHPVGWPAYNGMVPNGFVNNMGFQQMPTDVLKLNADRDSKNNEKTNGTMETYVPSAIDKTNLAKPTGQSTGMVASGSSLQEQDISVKRAQQKAYQDELKKQMEIKKVAAEKDKQERIRYDMKLEKEIATYDPWGKSGCGAPVRNEDGKIVADLKKFLNKDFVITSLDGNTIQDKLPADLSPLIRALEMTQITQELTENEKKIDDLQKDNTSPSYGRGASLKELQGLTIKSPRDKKDQTSYKQFLQQQVEDKKKKEDEVKEKDRLEEIKENKRLADQQCRMREEYELEKEKQRKKAEELRNQNIALGLLAEQKKIEEDRKKKRIEDDKDADRKREAEMKLAQNTEICSPLRSNSPPIKTKRKSVTSKESEVQRVKTETMDYLNTIRDNLKIKEREDDVDEQKHLIRQLSALRKQLMRQELKVQNDLHMNKKKYSNLLSNEWDVQPKVNKRSAFDRATSITSGRKRHPLGTAEYQQLHEDDHHNEQQDLDSQQQEYMRQQEMRLLALRQGVENKTIPPEFELNRQTSKQSLLQSDSKFFSIENQQEVKNVKSINGSAHSPGEGNQLENENIPPKFVNNDITDTSSISTLQVEDIAHKNEERLNNLKVGDIARKNEERNLDDDNTSETNADNDSIINDFMKNK